MKSIMILLVVILITSSFKPDTNILIGKWELFYISTAEGGWVNNGKDTISNSGFSDYTLKHGQSMVVEFKEDSSYTSYDFRFNSFGTVSKGRYTIIDKDKMFWVNRFDTLLYYVIKDTLILQMQYPGTYNYIGQSPFLMKFIRQNNSFTD